jgi:hypothetical protein
VLDFASPPYMLSCVYQIMHSITYSSSPDSMNTDRNDKNSSGLSTAMYKLIVPLLRCEVADIRDAAVNALGLINPDALKYVFIIIINYFVV